MRTHAWRVGLAALALAAGCELVVGTKDVRGLADADVGGDAAPPDAGGPDADPAICGNGLLGAGEGCDDGNTVGGDGCGATCQIEIGWSCDNTFTPSRCSGEMVAIPAGDFMMGSTATADEQPVHKVTLSPYWMDAHEVTNAEYLRCEAVGECSAPSNQTSSTRNPYHGATAYRSYPVIYVTWTQAAAYCAWAGKRLPTEAEWEKAARGGCEVMAPTTCGTEDQRQYPWGSTPAPTCTRANCTPTVGAPCVAGSDTDFVGTRPSGDGPYGVHDLAGNVWEWVADWYDDTYYSQCASGCSNPAGPATSPYASRVARGGAYFSDATNLGVSFRVAHAPADSYEYLGFRCAKAR